jgi:hypothetical protein
LWCGRELFSWKDRLDRDGVTVPLRIQLRELLAPMVKLRKPFSWSAVVGETEVPSRLDQLVSWELVLAADDVHLFLQQFAKDEKWRAALPTMIGDCQQLLGDALDLRHELDDAGNGDDRSHWDLPSISQHWQNRGFRDWVALIELVRDAWLAIREGDLALAVQLAQAWFLMPRSTFKRLALFAASCDGCILPDQWVNWLVSDHARWLWASETKREVLRLLVLQGRHLTQQAKETLETAILAGPLPRDGSEFERRQDVVDYWIWLRLAKLQSSGGDLTADAGERLHVLSEGHPDWRLSKNQSDEFSHWMSGTGDPDFKDNVVVDIAPRERSKLVQWLKHSVPSDRPFYEDTWREICREESSLCADALRDLAQEGLWPSERWHEALQVWGEKELASRSWRLIGKLVGTVPSGVLKDIANSVAWWLKAVSESLDHDEGVFWDLCCRILELPYEDGVDDSDAVQRAINHPVGHITEALLNLWFKRKPNDNETLPPDMGPIFTKLCDTKRPWFRHGRVLLASRLIAFFRVDRVWTEANLLPLFDWTINTAEASAAWQGFLWSPRLYAPLLIAFKKHFLDTVYHHTELGEDSEQFALFLTYAALEPVDTYTTQDFQSAIAALSQDGLNAAARAIVEALEGSGTQKEDYWTNRILPFWQDIWPKSSRLASVSIAESLARLSIAAGDQFPSALATIRDWLQPIEHPHSTIHLLHESDLCRRFPKDVLSLLDAIIRGQQWLPSELKQCLTVIREASPILENDPRYQRLLQYLRQRET